MVELGQYMLGEKIAFRYVGVAAQDERFDTDGLIRRKFGCHLVRVANDGGSGTGTGTTNTGPEVGLGVAVVVGSVA